MWQNPGLFLTALPLVICGTCIALSLFAFLRQTRVPGSRPFGFLLLAAAVYVGATGMEHASVSLSRILLWVKIEYLGVILLGPLWLLFSLRFAGRRLPRPLTFVALFAGTAVMLVALAVPSLFSLIYPETGTRMLYGSVFFTATRGPLYWLNIVFVWVPLLIGIAVLFDNARHGPAAHRGKAKIALAGSLLPAIANALYIAGVIPSGLDPVPYAISCSGIFFAWALFRWNLLDVVSLARQRVLETMDDGLLVADADGAIIDCNPAAIRLLGVGESSHDDLDHALAAPRFAALLALMSEGSGECRLCELGSRRDLEVRARVFTVADNTGRSMGTAVVLSDVTQEASLMNRLRQQATLDGLTGAMNRRRFVELASRDIDLARRSSRPVALIMMDLDHFKKVNDRLGHAAGDEVLKAVVVRCQITLRTTDILCRFGGEEFAILLPNTDGDEARLVAERLRAMISTQPVAWERAQIRITTSLGVFASVPAEGEDLDFFLRRADEALYEAKSAGRNRVAVSGC